MTMRVLHFKPDSTVWWWILLKMWKRLL